MTKTVKRDEARRLRHEGQSIKEIARELGVSRSSVSTWVRDIELTPEQQRQLKNRQRNYEGEYAGSQALIYKHRAIRQTYQDEGRQKAREGDPLHLAGCMLYWAEGKKTRNKLTLVNSDADLLCFFARFLRHSLQVTDDQIAVHIHCYLGNGLTLAEIEAYWLQTLDLPAACLKKTMLNAQPVSSQQKGRKLPYGVCALAVYQTRLVQHVYGAIQGYAGIDKPEWFY